MRRHVNAALRRSTRSATSLIFEPFFTTKEGTGGAGLVAASAAEALLVSERHPDPIAILVTDIVMPHMNGVELAERLVLARPELKVLCVSGYTEKRLVDRVMERRFSLLQKPVLPDVLAHRIRELLDSVTASGTSHST